MRWRPQDRQEMMKQVIEEGTWEVSPLLESEKREGWGPRRQAVAKNYFLETGLPT